MNYKKILSLFLTISIGIDASEAAVAKHLVTTTVNSSTTEFPHNIFTASPDATISTLQKRFEGKKLAIYVDFHDVFAIKSHANAWKRFKANSVPTLFKKVEAVALLAGILIPGLCNAARIGLTKRDAQGNLTEKRKIGENYQLFVKKWWSVKLYNYFIQYATDLYSPNEALIELLYKLKAAGHRIYLFSNGGYDTITAVEADERFKKYFEGADRLFSDTPIDGQNSNSINHTLQDEYTLAKPAPHAFESALVKHGEDAQYVIFLDDSRSKLPDYKNEKITQRYPGFTNFWACSILYDAAKHHEAEDTLQMLGVLKR